MGVDIYAYSGVVVTSKQLSAMICEGNRERASRLLLRHTALLLQSLKHDKEHPTLPGYALKEWDRVTQQRLARTLTRSFQSLEITSSVEAIRSMLQSMTQDEDSGTSQQKQSAALGIWTLLLKELHPRAPIPEKTLFIDSPRYQGRNLPQGEVLFVFEEFDCFTYVKTETGRALDEILGVETRLATWTTYSV